MARRRRVRVPLGFGSGGRAALVSSLLPTASEKAEADRSKRAVDNQKIASFNREETTLAELEAYFSERLAQTADTVAKTDIQGLLDNARAADKKRGDAKIGNQAKDALADFQSGNASYETTKEILQSAKGRAKDPELVKSIERLIKDAGQVSTQREINTRIEDFNKGRTTYGALAEYLDKQVASTTNEVIKQQIVKAQDGARAQENNKVLSSAQESYKAGRITIEEFTNRLHALRSDPRQKDPGELEKIAATIAMGEANEQSVIDHKKYVSWQSGGTTDKEALEYFQGRLAVTKTAQGTETLGKYAASVKGKIDAAEKTAASMAGRVNSQASQAAKAQVAADRTSVAKAFKEYDTEFDKLVEAAHGDPAMVTRLYAHRAEKLKEYATITGASAKEYQLMTEDNNMSATAAIAKGQWVDYEKDIARISKELLTPAGGTAKGQTAGEKSEGTDSIGANLPIGLYVKAQLQIAERARLMEENIYATPDQRKDAGRTSNNSFLLTKTRIEEADVAATRAEGAYKGSIQSAWNDTNVDGVNIAASLYKTFDEFDAAVRKDPRGVLSQVFLKTNPNKNAQDADKYVQGVVASMHAFDENKTTILGADKGAGLGGDDRAGLSEVGKLKILFLEKAYPNSWVNNIASDESDEFRGKNLAGRRSISDSAFEQPFMGAERKNDPTDRLIVMDNVTFKPRTDYPGFRGGLTSSPIEVPTVDADGNPLPITYQIGAAVWMGLGASMSVAIRNATAHAGWIEAMLEMHQAASQKEDAAAMAQRGDVFGRLSTELGLITKTDAQTIMNVVLGVPAKGAENIKNTVTDAAGAVAQAGGNIWGDISRVVQQFSAARFGAGAAETRSVSGEASPDSGERRLQGEVARNAFGVPEGDAAPIDDQAVLSQEPAPTRVTDQTIEAVEAPPLFAEISAGDPWDINTPPVFESSDPNPWWQADQWTPPTFDIREEWNAAPIEDATQVTPADDWTPPTFELPDFGGGANDMISA